MTYLDSSFPRDLRYQNQIKGFFLLFFFFFLAAPAAQIHSTDNARTLNHQATRELPGYEFKIRAYDFKHKRWNHKTIKKELVVLKINQTTLRNKGIPIILHKIYYINNSTYLLHIIFNGWDKYRLNIPKEKNCGVKDRSE